MIHTDLGGNISANYYSISIYRKSDSNKIKLKVNSYRLNETAQYEKRKIIKSKI